MTSSIPISSPKHVEIPFLPYPTFLQVHDMIENTFIKQSQCMFSGCPSVTHRVDLTLPWRSRDVYCDPLAFYSGTSAPPALREWAIHARIPNNAYNHGTIARQDNTIQFIKYHSPSRYSHSFSCSTLNLIILFPHPTLLFLFHPHYQSRL